MLELLAMPLACVPDSPWRFAIREAVPGDEALALSFVRRLAEYERLADGVRATEASLRSALFERRYARAAFAMGETGNPSREIGIAIWYYGYSTFRGAPILYLEDLYVDAAWRGKGVATRLFAYLRDKAREVGCDRIEWSVLGWNATAKDFYRSLGGKHKGDWEPFCLDLR